MVALVFVALVGLIAWLNPPPPAPVVPPPVVAPQPQADRIILLPDAAGTVGPVLLRSSTGKEQLVSRAWDAAEVSRDGQVVVNAQEPAVVQARYRQLLEARPLMPVDFTVYFRSGSNELVPESQAMLEQVRVELGRRPVPEILVIGHTDRVGTLAANDELSRRRAEAVKALLVQFGLSAEQIETSGRGEREPLVPTADEVAEPRNRRVDISVH